MTVRWHGPREGGCQTDGVSVNPQLSPREDVVLVDREGTVVGAAPRSEVRRDNLLHAATAVLVRNASGQIYVHRRSPDKDWAPGHHDACAGGMLRVGEEPEPSARRELAEELGIDGEVDLLPLGHNLYEDEFTRCRESAFEVRWDGPVRFADHEVVWGSWMTLPELGIRLREPRWPFVPDTRQLLVDLAARNLRDYASLALD